jgi:hypothetical protein
VVVKTDLNLSGAVAQYGRASGMIQDVAQQLIGQFANSLKAQLGQSQTASVAASAAQPEAKPAEPPKAQAISGFSLLFMMIGAFFRRLSGSSKA